MDQLLDISARFHKRLLLVWAVAILWIYVGNIINFHQHRIWGKQLIPVACTSKRFKEKSLAGYQGFARSHSIDISPDPVFDEPSSFLELKVYPIVTVIFNPSSGTSLVTCCIQSPSPRGPPSA